MFVSGPMPRLRRATYLVLSAAIASYIYAMPAAIAQEPSFNGFSSSTSALAGDAVASPGAEATGSGSGGSGAAAAGQSGSYGTGSHGFWNMNRLAFEAGGGFNAPIGNDLPFITWGGNFTVGAGLRASKHFSGLIEYQFIDDKLPADLISDAGAQGGHAHIWSLTLDAAIDLFPNSKTDAYVTGGGGFYRKVTSFTDPEAVEECYFYCVIGVENVVVDHFSSNQGGANFGVGITRKIGGQDSNMKLYAEARYLWLNTPGLDKRDGLGETELIPVTLGVRW